MNATQAIAAEIAQDEAKHVAWLQAQLGLAAIPMPQVRDPVEGEQHIALASLTEQLDLECIVGCEHPTFDR